MLQRKFEVIRVLEPKVIFDQTFLVIVDFRKVKDSPYYFIEDFDGFCSVKFNLLSNITLGSRLESIQISFGARFTMYSS